MLLQLQNTNGEIAAYCWHAFEQELFIYKSKNLSKFGSKCWQSELTLRKNEEGIHQFECILF